MKTRILLIVTLALAFASCDKFLTETPRHAWEMGEAISSYTSAQQAVTGIYGIFMPGDNLNMDLNVAYTSKSGMMKINERDYELNYQQKNTKNQLWSTGYRAINAANMAIVGVEKVADSSFPSPEAKAELLGEARFLRGYLYAQLLLNYCQWWNTDDSPYGLVYRDQVSDATNIFPPRISVGESWAKVLEDIDFGIANMSETFASPRRATRFFAKAYKAKLLLIRGGMRKSDADIQESKKLVDECLANLPSGVSMNPDMAAHFAQAWDSSENIFVRYLENNAQSRKYDAGYWCNYGLGYNASTKCIINDVPVEQKDAACGIEYGLDWMSGDPRWFISTGKGRAPENWDDTYYWTWTKIYRKGKIEEETDGDMKYAVYLMRVPELYIMQAELRLRTGASLAESIAPINQMRAKRTNPVLPAVEVPSSKDEAWDIIFQEYCKELILENGCEYFASVRIPKNGKTYMEHIKGGDFVYDQSKLQWPIPDSEMINNISLKGMQNPGQE